MSNMTAMCMIWVTRCRVMPFTKIGNGKGKAKAEVEEVILIGGAGVDYV